MRHCRSCYRRDSIREIHNFSNKYNTRTLIIPGRIQKKLQGILHSISIIEYIQKKYNVTKGAITEACNGTEAIKK